MKSSNLLGEEKTDIIEDSKDETDDLKEN